MSKLDIIKLTAEIIFGGGFVVFGFNIWWDSHKKNKSKKAVRKELYWLLKEEIKKNTEILDGLKKRCEDKLAHPRSIFRSVNFVYYITDYILSNLIELNITAEQFKKLQRMKIHFENIIYIQDEYIRVTVDDPKLVFDPIIATQYLTNLLTQINGTRDFLGKEIEKLFIEKRQRSNIERNNK